MYDNLLTGGDSENPLGDAPADLTRPLLDAAPLRAKNPLDYLFVYALENGFTKERQGGYVLGTQAEAQAKVEELPELTDQSGQKNYNKWFADYYGKVYFQAACWMLKAQEGDNIDVAKLLGEKQSLLDNAKEILNQGYQHAQVLHQLYHQFHKRSQAILNQEKSNEIEKQRQLKKLLGTYVAAQEIYMRETVKFEYNALLEKDKALLQSKKARAASFFAALFFGALALTPFLLVAATPAGWIAFAGAVFAMALILIADIVMAITAKPKTSYFIALLGSNVIGVLGVVASLFVVGLLSNPFTAVPVLAMIPFVAALLPAIMSLASMFGFVKQTNKAINSENDLAKKGVSEALATSRALVMGKDPVHVCMNTSGFNRETRSLKVNQEIIKEAESTKNTGRSESFDSAVTIALKEARHIPPYIKRRTAFNANTKIHTFTTKDGTEFSILSASVAFPFGAKEEVRQSWLEENIRDMAGRLFLKALKENQALYEKMGRDTIQVSLLYNTILTSLFGENWLPHVDNNTRFIREIQIAVEKVAAELGKELVTVKLGDKELQFQPNLVYTNHAVNKRRNWIIAQSLEAMNNASDAVLLEGVAQLAEKFVSHDFADYLKGKAGKHTTFRPNEEYQKLDQKDQQRLDLKFKAAAGLRYHIMHGGQKLPQPGAEFFKNALEDITADATWVGCKSARDRTAHQLAAIVVLMQNPDWMSKPLEGKEFIDAVNAEIETGYYLRMSFGAEKISVLGSEQTRESFVYQAGEIPKVVVKEGLFSDKTKKSDVAKVMTGNEREARGWFSEIDKDRKVESAFMRESEVYAKNAADHLGDTTKKGLDNAGGGRFGGPGPGFQPKG